MKMTPDKIRYAALFLLVPIGLLGLATLNTPSMQVSLAHGPIQSGHEDLECVQCHITPDASWRQQIQANVRYTLGRRLTPVDFGYKHVDSDTCLSCHERSNERHPIYRFREPRFHEALAQVDATSCLGCHSEHAAERSFVEVSFCSACHASLELKSDPIDVSHKALITQKKWESCLGCHDFHGNHVFETPLRVKDAFRTEELRSYLAAGPSPYGDTKQFGADAP